MNDEELSDVMLAHYGVLGMKWGVRKDGKPQGTIGKAIERGNKRSEVRRRRIRESGQAKTLINKTKRDNTESNLTKKEQKQRLNEAKSEARVIRKKAQAKAGKHLVDAAGGSKTRAHVNTVGRSIARGLVVDVGHLALAQVSSNPAYKLGLATVSAGATTYSNVRTYKDIRDVIRS